MEYNENREVNEMEKRDAGQRNIVDSSELMSFLGGDNYQNKAEELLLDILNNQYPLKDAVEDILSHESE